MPSIHILRFPLAALALAIILQALCTGCASAPQMPWKDLPDIALPPVHAPTDPAAPPPAPADPSPVPDSPPAVPEREPTPSAPLVARPDTGPDLPGTFSEQFRWKHQIVGFPHHGHPAGARVKILLPSWFYREGGLRQDNAVMVLNGVARLTPWPALDKGDDSRSTRLQFEFWHDHPDWPALMTGAPLQVAVYRGSDPVLTLKVESPLTDRQAPLSAWPQP